TQPLTRYAYAIDLKLFFHFLTTELPEFAEVPIVSFDSDQLKKITARHVELYLDYLSYYIAPDDGTAITNAELGKQRKLSSLRSFYKYLFRHKYVGADISALIDMPKRHDKPIVRMEIDEVARMLDLVESGEALTERQKKYHDLTAKRDLAMLTLFLGTGIRVSECVGLDMEDIDFSINGFLVTRKGGSQSILYFPDEVADVLRDYLTVRREMVACPGQENALFLSLQKKRMSIRAVENMVKKYATQAAPLKKKLSPHKLRSTFGTHLYHETGDIYLVADVLGHSDVNTTRRHYAAMSDDKRRLAARSIHLREDSPGKPIPEAEQEDQ
ncbi:MAG: tyrosine-type recombinase/integrase, partial [Clostridia bacterium]|nr:tyrosine-type recombinase/integrase [Clostridia bacterium]